MKERWEQDDSLNFWPVVADAFIGFLALVVIVGLAAYSKGQAPPIAKRDFKQEFEGIFKSLPGVQVDPLAIPRVRDEGFSEINIYFPANFLFDKCQVELSEAGKVLLVSLRGLLSKFDRHIQRVQIIGHTDTDRPKEGGECYRHGITTNWELSARRAIRVVELLAPDQGNGLDPRKVWATALGEYHPVVEKPGEGSKAQNRRIEVLVRFRER